MNFLAELVKRFLGETPAFFKTLQKVTIVIGIITGLPTFLTEAGLDFPDAWDTIILKVVSVASFIGTFIAQLTLTQKAKEIDGIK